MEQLESNWTPVGLYMDSRQKIGWATTKGLHMEYVGEYKVLLDSEISQSKVWDHANFEGLPLISRLHRSLTLGLAFRFSGASSKIEVMSDPESTITLTGFSSIPPSNTIACVALEPRNKHPGSHDICCSKSIISPLSWFPSTPPLATSAVHIIFLANLL